MKRSIDLSALSLEQLKARFIEIGINQYDALVEDNIPRLNRLVDQIREIDFELRRQGRTAREALIPLFEHPNIQVRLMAARLSLAVAPEAARATLGKIVASNSLPQSMDAGMAFFALDKGIFVPD